MTSCDVGQYQQDYSKSDCSSCEESNYCPGRATTSLTICTEGHYCPPDTAHPIPCPEGTYSDTQVKQGPRLADNQSIDL